MQGAGAACLRKTAALIPHQRPCDIREPNLSAPTQAFRHQDRAQHIFGLIEIIVHDDIVILGPMRDFGVGLGHARLDDFFRILIAPPQPVLEHGTRRRKNENLDDIAAGDRIKLLRALPVDVEQKIDAMGELANMIVGSVKAALVEKGKSCVLTIPSIVRGSNISIEAISTATRRVLCFQCGDSQKLVVELMIKPPEANQ